MCDHYPMGRFAWTSAILVLGFSILNANGQSHSQMTASFSCGSAAQNGSVFFLGQAFTGKVAGSNVSVDLGLVSLVSEASLDVIIIRQLSLTADGACAFSFAVRPDKTYFIEVSDDLVSWRVLEELLPSESGTFVDPQDSSTPMRFYRVRWNL